MAAQKPQQSLEEALDTGQPPSGDGCVECGDTGGWWVHLRRCATCGHVGCCDTSPSQHASRHYRETGHRLIQSFEPGEDWFFDFVSAQMFDGPALAPPASRPDANEPPWPRALVPADWMNQVHQ